MPISKDNNSYGIQVVFSTIPHQDNKNYSFESDLEKQYFQQYRKDVDEENKYPFLYQPIKYYLFGDFDVVYISLINNFKFSHRLFEPKSESKDLVYNAHTFQSYSGFALNKPSDLEKIFTPNDELGNKKLPISYFIGVIHLKLNNGIYIGNGEDFITVVHKYIAELFKDIDYILSQTFAWFEISLVAFVNSPDELSDLLLKLRLSKLNDIIKFGSNDDELQSIIDASLYKEIHKNDEKHINKVKNVSLFADTNSHFGINERLIKGNYTTTPVDEYVVNFADNIAKSIPFKTEIEWQVKPNHIIQLVDMLSSQDFLSDKFKTSFKDTNIVLGKCDYLIQENEDNVLSNFHLLRFLNQTRAQNCDIFAHIRKVRTYVFLTSNDKILAEKKEQYVNSQKNDPLSWEATLKKIAVKAGDFSKVEEQLKALKVSRQIRIKILKIFSNYNNGIQDPIQFPYFLDFWLFINNLIQKIGDLHELSKKHNNNLRGIEKDLDKILLEFEEGFEVRFLNGYQFESINDFDLDFNNSVQQLLTSYGTMIYEFGKLYFKDKYYPIIQLNNIDTVSNYESIHYFGHHLTSPEFVFASVLKEILNHLDYGDIAYGDLVKELKNYMPKLKAELNETYFDDMYDSDMIDLNYFAIDVIRFKTSFRGEFDLYEHWFWLYHFQNSYNFNTNGTFNEQRLKMEMFRLMLIYKIFKINKDDLECPSPEIFNIWDRHYNKINIIIDKILEYSRENEPNDILSKIFIQVNIIIDNTKSVDNLVIPIREMESMSYKILKEHFLKNNKKITSLKRDWVTGKPIEEYKALYENIFYAPDQTGGSFFYNCDAMQKYFNDSVLNLKKIINFSSVNKKDFIIEQINKR